jgi:peroxiredoxin Q/BCP
MLRWPEKTFRSGKNSLIQIDDIVVIPSTTLLNNQNSSMSELSEGTAAPTFTANDQNGNPVSLTDFKGKKVILFFYPKDNTPGCTKEACAYRDNYTTFESKNTVLLGISPDNEKSHTKFIEKFDLPYTLICDTDKSICEAYGVWVEKSMYGKKYMGVERSTFLIDKEGNLVAIKRKVKPEPHVAEMLEMVS